MIIDCRRLTPIDRAPHLPCCLPIPDTQQPGSSPQHIPASAGLSFLASRFSGLCFPRKSCWLFFPRRLQCRPSTPVPRPHDPVARLRPPVVIVTAGANPWADQHPPWIPFISTRLEKLLAVPISLSPSPKLQARRVRSRQVRRRLDTLLLQDSRRASGPAFQAELKRRRRGLSSHFCVPASIHSQRSEKEETGINSSPSVALSAPTTAAIQTWIRNSP